MKDEAKDPGLAKMLAQETFVQISDPRLFYR